MAGVFDNEIRMAMNQARSPRADDAGIYARDIAARNLNMQQRGVNSTAFKDFPQNPAGVTGHGVAGVSGHGLPGAAQQQPSMDEMIAAQLGESMPIPGARPNPMATPDIPVQQMGDASVAEAMQGTAPTAAPPNIDTAIADQMGDVVQSGAPPPVNVAAPLPQPGTTQAGFDPTMLISTVAALGGTAGVASLISRYRMGDPDAARTFQAIGIHPDELAMFAGDVMPERQRGTAASPEQDRKKSKGGDEGKKKSAPQKQDEKASGDRDGKKTRVKVKAKF